MTLRSPLESRRRVAARTALYVGLSGVIAAGVAIVSWLQPSLLQDAAVTWAGRDFSPVREVQLLRQYIAIDTTSPDGDEAAGAAWVARQLADMGLQPHVESVGDQANVWAILEGRRKEAVVLHHHIDVDPVPDVDHWRYDPFAGTIEGPWLFGRGAFDMKSVAVAQLEAVRSLVERRRRPERSVIVLATAEEESGSDLGTRWFLHEHPELVKRFGAVLSEGGAVEAVRPGVAKYWGTEVAQARLLRVRLCGGSREALQETEGTLAREVGLEGEPRLVPEIRAILERYAPTRDSPRLRRMLSDPRALLRDRVAFRGLSSYVRSYFVSRILPQGVRPAEGGGYELLLNVLVLPGADPQAVLRHLLPGWVSHGFEVEVYDDGGSSTGSPVAHWAFQALDETLHELHPEIVHGPLYLPGTLTDARFFRARGIPTYGFTPFNIVTPEVINLRRYETVDEKISLPGFIEGVDLYRRALARLAR